jgi:broad specificity phosphatase PhoE
VVSGPARLVLVRHGATGQHEHCVGQRLDPGLSEEGRSQAVRAAATVVELLGGPPDRIVTSPLRRARETAEAIAAQPEVDGRLVERDFGDWEGRPWGELWPTVEPAVLTDPTAYTAFIPPAAETMAEVAIRVQAAVEDLTAVPGSDVVAVTHGGPLRLAVAAALRLDAGQTFALGAEHGRCAVLARYGDEWVLERLGV